MWNIRKNCVVLASGVGELRGPFSIMCHEIMSLSSTEAK